jgi:purine nucleosidase
MAKYGSDGAPLHDPCTIAWLLRPDLFTGREINIEIETEGRFTTGMMVADWWRVSGRAANALFLRNVDADGFFALLTERLARF